MNPRTTHDPLEPVSLSEIHREYLIARAALPCAKIRNIGILLLDRKSDELYCRFRRDLDEFAGDESDWFKELPQYILHMARKLGGQKCLEWLESMVSSSLRISERKRVPTEWSAIKTVDVLYAKHIRPKVLRFRTHLPQYSLEAAAGKFGRKMNVDPEGWVEVRTGLPLTEDMFVVHVLGHSMEPTIPDGSLCAFRAITSGPWEGKILLLEAYGEPGGSRHTVKLCHLSKSQDPNGQGEIAWLHHRVTLESVNPAYESWDVASVEKIRPLGEFLFVV
jgi:hypothetical protein